MRTLDDMMGRNNNLDALRLFAAIGVIFSHAYPLTYGTNAREPLMLLSGGQLTIGELCVCLFFVISGFLITQSFARSPSAIDYLTNRVVRIMPALAVVTIITCLIMGPILTTLPSAEYYNNYFTFRYLGNILIYPSAQRLPGVFEENTYAVVTNGSIWTLSYEFTCYTALAAIGLAIRRAWMPATLLLAFTTASAFLTYVSPRLLIGFSGYFFAGSCFYLLRKHVVLNFYIFLACLAILGAALTTETGFRNAFYLFGTYAVIYLAYCSWLRVHEFASHGDLSYGVYIYAFPAQQIVSSYIKTPVLNFMFSMPVVLVLAYFSWHLIERPALSRRQQLSDFTRRQCARLFALSGRPVRTEV